MSTSVNTNTAATGATNISIATETVGSDQVQRIKVITGVSGVDGGDVTTANPFPVVDAGTATGNASLATIATNTAGASTATLQTTGNTLLASIDTKTPALTGGGRVPVDPSGVTSPVSAASLPLPSGASTAAKQPALGTAGAPSADVLTVQGATSMTALKVDGSAVTQPVSAASLPLPAGAATQTTLAAVVTALGGPLAVATSTAVVSATPTVTASSAYAAGNVVGGKLTFASAVGAAGGGVIQSARIACKTVQAGALKLYIFSQDPSNSTWTDKSAAAINAADIPFLIDILTFSIADSGLGTHTIYPLDGIGKSFVCTSGSSLFGVLVTSGTPTFGSTSDITVSLNILKDQA